MNAEKNKRLVHQCTPEKQGYWILKIFNDEGDEYRCTGCGKWATKGEGGLVEKR